MAAGQLLIRGAVASALLMGASAGTAFAKVNPASKLSLTAAATQLRFCDEVPESERTAGLKCKDRANSGKLSQWTYIAAAVGAGAGVWLLTSASP